MKPLAQERTLVTSGVEEQASFGISNNDQAHIMRILRDQLYSDRVLAVIREYSSNAWDANRVVGKQDVPIEVNLPTLFQPYLSIKDSGPGLSQHDVFKVYTQYGASTKRDSNETVGMLGIGSKSAFAYTSAFTVTSWHGGIKSIYNASLDEHDIGVMQLLHQEPCGDETGIEIKVPVKNADFHEFTNKAKMFFEHFSPTPKFNIAIQYQEYKHIMLDSGFIMKKHDNYSYHASVGILGCIPYKIASNELNFPRNSVLGRFATIGLYFDIGEVDFSASREELKYTTHTRDAIKKKLESLDLEVQKELNQIWEDHTKAPWEKRQLLSDFRECGVDVHELMKRLKLPAPEIEVEKDKCNFNIIFSNCKRVRDNSYNKFNVINLNHHNSIIIRDDNRTLKGFSLPNDAIVIAPKITPTNKPDVAQVKAEIDKFLSDLMCEGYPIKLLSSYTWSKPVTKVRLNSKHAKKEFAYTHCNFQKNSDLWEPITFTPSDDDVFVIIESFAPKSMEGSIREKNHFSNIFEKDKKLALLAGIDFPQIKGYKTTQHKPLTIADCKGQHYSVWQKQFYENAKKSQIVSEYIDIAEWTCINVFGYTYDLTHLIKKYESVGLGQHEFVVLIKTLSEKKEKLHAIQKSSNGDFTLVKNIYLSDFEASSRCTKKHASFLNRYPLLDIDADKPEVIGHNAEYIQLIDERDAKLNALKTIDVIPVEMIEEKIEEENGNKDG